MNKESLLQKCQQIEAEFDAIQNQQQVLSQQYKAGEDKLVELRGRHAALSELIKEIEDMKTSLESSAQALGEE